MNPIPRPPFHAAFALILLALGPAAYSAQPVTIDRVIAVVEQQPILLSELHRRVALYESNARRSGTTIEPAARRQLVHQSVEAMIDEILIGREAESRQITVSDDELERAVSSVAESNGLSPEQVYAEAEKAGMDRAAYREELIRTLREQKLLQLDVAGKVRVEDDDVHAAYDRMVADKRRQRPYHVAWIVVRIPRDAGPAVVDERRARADEVMQKARAGSPFAELARQYSDDTVTNTKGGDLGERVPRGAQQGMTLRSELEEEALQLDVGETSAPIRLDDAFVILHLVGRPTVRLPTFESTQEYLRQQVYGEKLAEARKSWLEALRSKSFVELRFTPTRPAEESKR